MESVRTVLKLQCVSKKGFGSADSDRGIDRLCIMYIVSQQLDQTVFEAHIVYKENPKEKY